MIPTIRPYRDADWPRLCAIHDAARQTELALAGLPDAFLPLEIAAQREGLFSYTLRVAELDGQAAGFAAFTNDELAWLYVDPALARRGVGRALMARLLEDRRTEALTVNAAPYAVEIYRRLGFRPTDRERLAPDGIRYRPMERPPESDLSPSTRP